MGMELSLVYLNGYGALASPVQKQAIEPPWAYRSIKWEEPIAKENPNLERRTNQSLGNLGPPLMDGNSDERNWKDLPESVAFSILTLLPSFVDLSSAACVSRAWNAAAVSVCNSNDRPPFILSPLIKRSLRVTAFESTLTSKSYNRDPLPFPHPFRPSHLVGHDFTKLIFVTDAVITLDDVYSGEQIRSAEIPCLRNIQIDFGTLTAPLDSSSLSIVLLVGHYETRGHLIISWEPNGSGNRDGKFAHNMKIVSIALLNGQVYYLDSILRVGVVEFEPGVSTRLLGDMLVEDKPFLCEVWDANHYLVVHDDELLMVLFLKNSTMRCMTKIEVYKFDLGKPKWVKMEILNNWCLFIDGVRKMGFSCKRPERWGGRSNCIYLAGSNHLGYSTYMLDHEDEEFRLMCSFLASYFSSLWLPPYIKSMKKVETGAQLPP